MNKPKARDKAMRMYRRSNFDYEWKRRQEISKQNGKVIKIKRKGAPQGPLKATVYRIMKEKKIDYNTRLRGMQLLRRTSKTLLYTKNSFS